jgi:hypothetical protein
MSDDINSLAWPAMRYALGRKTYVVDTVCRALINQKANIRDDIRERIGQEIRKAIMEGEAGMPMDVARWVDVLETFK